MSLSGESITIKSYKNINTELQLLLKQNEFLNPELSRLLNNSLIQPHFGKKIKNTGYNVSDFV